MIINLSVNVLVWVVPQCAGGVIFSLDKMPKLLDKIPAGIKANATFADEKKDQAERFKEGYKESEDAFYGFEKEGPNEQTISVYFDCKDTSKRVVSC